MSHRIIEAVGWALVHFIWQGAAIALAAASIGAAMRRARPNTRYVVFCGALVLMLLAPVTTFLVVSSHQSDSTVAPMMVSIATASPVDRPPPSLQGEPLWLPLLVQVWLAGVMILSLRSLGGWMQVQRLKRWKTSPAAESLRRAASRLCVRLDIHRSVRILDSAIAEVPAAVGWLRPVVLLPVSALTALTPEQIELLIAHELAHIRRHDYLVNLAQTAVENTLFYHPAVWWVGGRIRAEREHCCDDLAVAACGDVVEYAHTLAALEALRAERTALVVAADGGSLLERIQRLSNRERRSRYAPPAWLGALLAAAVTLSAVVSVTPPEALAVDDRGFLAGLADAGYTSISVDEIIALKEHGVEPRYIKDMLAAGLPTPSVAQLIQLRDHGVEPDFVASVSRSGLVEGLDVLRVVRLRENDVRGADMARIRGLGFGPYSAEEVIRLRQNGVDATTFAALKEAGAARSGVAEAIEFRQNDVTVERIRDMKAQGFDNLNLEQILKLRRAGII